MPAGSDKLKLETKVHPSSPFRNFINKQGLKSPWMYWDDEAKAWSTENAKFPRWKGCLQCEVLTLLEGHSFLSYPTEALEKKFNAYLCRENLECLLGTIRSHVMEFAGHASDSVPAVPADAGAPSQYPTGDASAAASDDFPDLAGAATATLISSSEEEDSDDAILYTVIKYPPPRKCTRSAKTIDKTKLTSSYVDEFIDLHIPAPYSRQNSVIALFDVNRGNRAVRAGARISDDYITRQLHRSESLLLSDYDKELVVDAKKGGGMVTATVLDFRSGGERCVCAQRPLDATSDGSGGSSVEPVGEDPRSSLSWSDAMVRVLHKAGLASPCVRPRTPTLAELGNCDGDDESAATLNAPDSHDSGSSERTQIRALETVHSCTMEPKEGSKGSRSEPVKVGALCYSYVPWLRMVFSRLTRAGRALSEQENLQLVQMPRPHYAPLVLLMFLISRVFLPTSS